MQTYSPASLRRSFGVTGLLLLLGVLAGFTNGLLGTGGGILLVLILATQVKHAKSRPVSLPLEQRDIYANALAVMLPISVFSALQYAHAGTLDIGAFSPMILPSLAGGVIGGILLDRLKLSFLQRMFALLILISGVLMIVRG